MNTVTDGLTLPERVEKMETHTNQIDKNKARRKGRRGQGDPEGVECGRSEEKEGLIKLRRSTEEVDRN